MFLFSSTPLRQCVADYMTCGCIYKVLLATILQFGLDVSAIPRLRFSALIVNSAVLQKRPIQIEELTIKHHIIHTHT